MSTDTKLPPPIHAAQVELLPFHRALPKLRNELAEEGLVLVWAYLIDPLFFADLFANHLKTSKLLMLADSRQTPMLRALMESYYNLRAATWTTNRTMHDKTIVFPNLGITYLTTSNLTRGAWTMSLNSTVRVTSAGLTTQLADDFAAQWKEARVLPKFHA